MMDHRPFFFGYGSLVNRATHDYPDVAKARLRGWARTWKRTRLRQVAFLTAVRAPGAEIDGVIAAVPDADWTALDAREYAYDRHEVTDLDHGAPGQPSVSIYATKPEHHTDASEEHPILLSYLDTVIQGYLREFGEAGAAGFFDSTLGWDAPVLDDRAAPIYPRATEVSGDERAVVDAALAARGVRRLTSL